MNIRQVVRGDYVATPIKNAFNNKTSYWFSKKGCTVSLYMFTVGNGDTEKDFEERLSQNGFNEMVPRFEEHLRRPFNHDVYLQECNLLTNEIVLKKKLKEVMDDLLQKDTTCNFVITCGRIDTYLHNTLLSEACVEAYRESGRGNVKCYMAPLNKKAASPIFSVIDGAITYSGLLITI